MSKYIGADELLKRLNACKFSAKKLTKRQAAYNSAISETCRVVYALPAADVAEVVRCKDCEHWRQQTNYQGAPLSFGFCESDDMWQSLYGETYEVEHIDTDEDFYCGYAKRRTDG